MVCITCLARVLDRAGHPPLEALARTRTEHRYEHVWPRAGEPHEVDEPGDVIGVIADDELRGAHAREACFLEEPPQHRRLAEDGMVLAAPGDAKRRPDVGELGEEHLLRGRRQTS